MIAQALDIALIPALSAQSISFFLGERIGLVTYFCDHLEGRPDRPIMSTIVLCVGSTARL